MRYLVFFPTAMSAALLLTANPAFAAAGTELATNSTTPVSLSSGTELIDQGVTLNVGSGGNSPAGSGTIAISVTASSTITNLGTLEEPDTAAASAQNGRAIRVSVSSGTVTVTINNGSATNSSALIQTGDADAIQFNKANNGGTLNNYGQIISMNASSGGNQAIDWNAVTGVSNTVNNYSTGFIQATNADSVRPGVNGVINNSGTIKAKAANGSSDDGIDAQLNSGVTITNAAGTTAGAGATNLIEGARHGITGGQDIDTKDTSTYGLTFGMSITNNVGGTIRGDDGSGINIDGVNANELVTVMNAGTITGKGVTGDGDGVDVDGLVAITNSGTIQSLDAFGDASEGVTVGGGTITNSGTIEGSTTAASAGSGSFGRGITLAGVDSTTTNGVKMAVAIGSLYQNATVTNQNGGIIKGDSESGITVLGTTGGAKTVTIANNAGGSILGSNTGVSERGTGVLSGSSLNQAVIELDDTSNTYVVNEAGTITQGTTGTGTAIAMHGASNTLNITGATAVVTGDIAGDTPSDSVLNISPGAGNGFSYGYKISNFTVKVNYTGTTATTGTVTLSGANTYTGLTTVYGGKLYVNNTSGSGTGTGKIAVNGSAALGGTGFIQPGAGNGIALAAQASLISGGLQSGTTAGTGLTLDNTVAQGVILDASVGSANLTFSLGANHSATTMMLLGSTAGELKFASGDTITLNDLTSGGLQFNLNTPYVLIEAGTTPNLLSDNNLYAGLTTTGGVDGSGNIQNGYVLTSLPVSYNGVTYANTSLFLSNGELEVVPEPGTWAMMLGGLGALIFFQARQRKS